MQLDRLAVHLRRRSPWEAVDLGCAMARTWWRPVLAAWLPLYLGAALLVHLVFLGNHIAALLALWWLKPLFDRTALDVLARAVFGEQPRVREVLAAVMRSPGLFASLTLYRFDLARSFNLPVWHLERLRGRAASARARALHGRSRSPAVWATIVFLHFEWVLVLALWGAIALFTPAEYERELSLAWSFAWDTPVWQQWLQSFFYIAAVSLIEPFYVAAGFALYLNRRTQLEAWDVELALRRFAQRVASRPAPRAVAMVLLACGLALAAADRAIAAETQERSPKAVVQQILAEPEFSREREVKRWHYTGPRWRSDPGEPDKGKSWSIGAGFAEFARVAMWILGAGLVLAALYASRRYWGTWLSQTPPGYKPPATLFGLEIAPESLPPDVASAALRALEAGHAREALSLLYRGALSVLVTSGALEVRPGDTEGQCVREVAATSSAERSQYFARLVAAWQTAAYAKRMPAADVLRALCDEWRTHFAPGRAS